MPWTFIRSSELAEAEKQFEAKLAERGRGVALLTGLARESEAEKIVNDAEQ